jgi:hypothetical protein
VVDVVPEALARALRTWPFFGVPGADFAPISRSMSSGASQSGIMGEGEHVKPSSRLAYKAKRQKSSRQPIRK